MFVDQGHPISSNERLVNRPTNRLVVARKRYNSLDAGLREVSLLRATRMREFLRNVVMERKMLTAEK